jgi:hypothetical protein
LNAANEGGAISIRKSTAIPADKVNISISNSRFYYNTAMPPFGLPDDGANCWGGGICCHDLNEDSIIQRNRFEGNIADDYGGGVYLGNCKRVFVESNEFYLNNTRNFNNDPESEHIINGSAFAAQDFIYPDQELWFINNVIGFNEDYLEDNQVDAVGISNVIKSVITNNTIALNNANITSAVVIHGLVDDNPEPICCGTYICNNIFHDNEVAANHKQLLFVSFDENDKTLQVWMENNQFKETGNSFGEWGEGVYIHKHEPVFIIYDPDFVRPLPDPPEDINFNLNDYSDCQDIGKHKTSPGGQYYGIPDDDYKGDFRPLFGNNPPHTYADWDLGGDEYNSGS